ncbi:hypothetical protein [Spirosoma pollinicola]|nr:hypothetical protein [Spirosoma pollinicola]
MQRVQERKAVDPTYAEHIRQTDRAYKIRRASRPTSPVDEKPACQGSKERRMQQKRAAYRRMMEDPVKAKAERERKRRSRQRNPERPRPARPAATAELTGWKLVRHQIKQRKRETRKRENIKNDPVRLEAFRRRNLDKQRRWQQAIKNDPVRYGAYLQKQREYAAKRKAERTQRLIDATTPTPPTQTTKKPTRRKKTRRANISTWLGRANE